MSFEKTMTEAFELQDPVNRPIFQRAGGFKKRRYAFENSHAFHPMILDITILLQFSPEVQSWAFTADPSSIVIKNFYPADITVYEPLADWKKEITKPTLKDAMFFVAVGRIQSMIEMIRNMFTMKFKAGQSLDALKDVMIGIRKGHLRLDVSVVHHDKVRRSKVKDVFSFGTIDWVHVDTDDIEKCIDIPGKHVSKHIEVIPPRWMDGKLTKDLWLDRHVGSSTLPEFRPSNNNNNNNAPTTPQKPSLKTDETLDEGDKILLETSHMLGDDIPSVKSQDVDLDGIVYRFNLEDFDQDAPPYIAPQVTVLDDVLHHVLGDEPLYLSPLYDDSD